MAPADVKEDTTKRDAGSLQDDQILIPEQLPVLPLREVVTFPYMILPLVVSLDKAIHAVDQLTLCVFYDIRGCALDV